MLGVIDTVGVPRRPASASALCGYSGRASLRTPTAGIRPRVELAPVADTGISLIYSRLASRLLLFCLTRFPCGGAARGKTVATTSSIELLGGCHCGNIRVWLRLAQRPTEILLRACACSFCRMHGTRTVADPGGDCPFSRGFRSITGLCVAACDPKAAMGSSRKAESQNIHSS